MTDERRAVASCDTVCIAAVRAALEVGSVRGNQNEKKERRRKGRKEGRKGE